jgi:peptidylprolyl isomerase
MRKTSLAFAASLALACARTAPPPTPTALPAPIPFVAGTPSTAFALRQIDIVVGTGAAAESRKCLYAHYTGWLTDGKKFDSSRDTTARGEPRKPISFPQSFRRVIAGWDLGFEGMLVGGKRRLFIPYQLAYGERGRPPVIPAKAELIFDVELLAVADTLPTAPLVPGQRPPTGPTCAEWDALKPASP